MLDFDECWAVLESARWRRGGPVLLRGQDDRRLLPAGLHFTIAAATQHRLFRDDGGCRGGWVAGMQALPPDRAVLGIAAYCGRRKGLRAAAQ